MCISHIHFEGLVSHFDIVRQEQTRALELGHRFVLYIGKHCLNESCLLRCVDLCVVAEVEAPCIFSKFMFMEFLPILLSDTILKDLYLDFLTVPKKFGFLNFGSIAAEFFSHIFVSLRVRSNQSIL